MKREQVILAIEDSPESFLKLVESHRNDKEDVDLCEFWQALPRTQHGRVWSAVLLLAQGIAQRLVDGNGTTEEETGEQDKRECEDVEVLSAVVTMCQCALSLESLIVTNEFTGALQILHDILLSVPPEWCEVQNEMSAVCEVCWGRGEDVEGRETLVPNCLLYLVARTFSEGATKRDVGRVWAMRGALLLLDFEDPSADSIKELLLSTLIEPLYLTSMEGKRLLSFLFGLHPAFVEDLHRAIRNQLPWCPKDHLETYGEVYFKSWRHASGPYLKQIEEHCIQDLMYMAVHASRTGPHPAFHALRKVLGCIHQQNHLSGVSEMLLKLYNPFLWRSLKVANSHVRANAVCLMFDAFPLHNPTATREETDAVLQRQFDLMNELLFDASPMVRSLAALGVGRALSRYWEMVPVSVIRSLLKKMLLELAYDTASDNVRVAVIQSMCMILENRLSHALLHDLLPLLHNHIHDVSVKVRIAFLDLLLVVSGIRSIKFYEVCPVAHLLARMESDSVHVVKRIVSLLMNSFQPSHVPLSEQVCRCLTLIEMNMAAARRFYQLAVSHLPLSHTVRFLLALYATVSHCVEQGEREGEGEGEGVETKRKREGDTERVTRTRNKQREREREGEGVETKREGETERVTRTRNKSSKTKKQTKNDGKRVVGDGETDDGETGDCEGVEGGARLSGGWTEGEPEGDTSTGELCLANRDLLAGVLEVVVVLWELLRESLASPKHARQRLRLEATVTKSLPLLFNTLTDGRCRSALYFIASYLPRKNVADIVRGTLETLSSLDSSSNDYSAMVIAMTSWKQTDSVVRLVSQWLTTALDEVPHRSGLDSGGTVDNHTVALKNRKRGQGKNKKTNAPSVGRQDDVELKPVLGLNILNYMMMHPLCCEELKKQKKTWELEKSLSKCLAGLDAHLSPSDEATPTKLTFDLLQQMLSVYVRLALHRAATEGGGGEGGGGRGCEVVRERVREIREWSQGTLLPRLRGDPSQPAKRHSNRKRKANQSQLSVTSDPRVKEARQLAETLLAVTTEAVMIGLTDGELQMELAQWAGLIAESASANALLRPLNKLLFQLTETSAHSEVEGIKTPLNLRPTATLLQPLLQLAASSTSPEGFKKMWSVLHVSISQIVSTSLRLHLLSISPHPVPTITVLTNITMSIITEYLKEHPVQRDLSLNGRSSLSLSPFASAVMDLTCQDDDKASLFLSHLHSWLEGEEDEVQLSLLRHMAALHPLSICASRGKGSGELMSCVQSGLRLTEKGKGERWSEDVVTMSQVLEKIREKLTDK